MDQPVKLAMPAFCGHCQHDAHEVTATGNEVTTRCTVCGCERSDKLSVRLKLTKKGRAALRRGRG